MAPFTPFIAEEIYQNLTGEESVHLSSYPQGDKNLLDAKLVEQMKIAREITLVAHAKRKELALKVRQPLASITVIAPGQLSEQIKKVIAGEINVKKVQVKTGKSISVKLDTKISPQLEAEGKARDIIRSIQQLRKESGCSIDEKITVLLPSWPEEFTEEIKRQTLTLELIKSENLEVKRG